MPEGALSPEPAGTPMPAPITSKLRYPPYRGIGPWVKKGARIKYGAVEGEPDVAPSVLPGGSRRTCRMWTLLTVCLLGLGMGALGVWLALRSHHHKSRSSGGVPVPFDTLDAHQSSPLPPATPRVLPSTLAPPITSAPALPVTRLALCPALFAAVSPSARLTCEGDGDRFEVAVTAWNFRMQGARRPRAVLSPASSADVASALRVARLAGARVAVRNGGHAPTAHSLAPAGLTVDMKAWRRVIVRRAAAVEMADEGGASSWVADVEGGAVWGDVYRALEEHTAAAGGGTSLYAVGGGCGGVGVAGLLTAGGIAFSSRLHGLVVDNVLTYTLVLPNGTLATWGRREQPTLHRAVTAGRTALGVVWRVTLRLWEGALCFGVVELTDLQFHAQAAFEAIARAHADNLRAVMNERRWTLILEFSESAMFTFLYVGTPEEARRSGAALGLFERILNGSRVAGQMHIEHPMGERRALVGARWHSHRFRRLDASEAPQVRNGEFLRLTTMLQVATRYNSSQAVVWWRSTAVESLGVAGWMRVLAAAHRPSGMCHLQAEPIDGAIFESPAWPHAPAASLLSFVCMSDGVEAQGRPWHAAASQPTVPPAYDATCEAWIAAGVSESGVSLGAYAGYAHEDDRPENLIGVAGVDAVRRAQASVEGSVSLFGDVGQGWDLPAKTLAAAAAQAAADTSASSPPPVTSSPQTAPAVPIPMELITGGTSGIGLAAATRLMAAGRRVLLATHTPSQCEALAQRLTTDASAGGATLVLRPTCLVADLASTEGPATLTAAVRAALDEAGPAACLRSATFAASPGNAEYNATLDSPLSRIARVHFTSHRQLLRLLTNAQPASFAAADEGYLWCAEGEPRVIVVGSGASQLAVRQGVIDLLTGAPYWQVPSDPASEDDITPFFVRGGSGQLYAAAKLLEELMVLEAQAALHQPTRTSSSSADAASNVATQSAAHAPPSRRQPRPVRVVEVYPTGTVDTPTAAAWIAWSHISTITAAEAAAPIADALLDDSAARAAEYNQEVPAWASELFLGPSGGSLDRFLDLVHEHEA